MEEEEEETWRWREVQNEKLRLLFSSSDTGDTFQTEGEWRGEGLPAGAAAPPSSQSEPSVLAVMSSAH